MADIFRYDTRRYITYVKVNVYVILGKAINKLILKSDHKLINNQC